jgi:hypothetical protein
MSDQTPRVPDGLYWHPDHGVIVKSSAGYYLSGNDSHPMAMRDRPADAVKLGDATVAEVREVEAERNEQELRAIAAEAKLNEIRGVHDTATVGTVHEAWDRIRAILDRPAAAPAEPSEPSDAVEHLRDLAGCMRARARQRDEVGDDDGEEDTCAEEGLNCHTVSAVATWDRAASMLEKRADALAHGSVVEHQPAKAAGNCVGRLCAYERALTEEYPDGIEEASEALPDPARAAQRVGDFLRSYGDGRVCVAITPLADYQIPPLYARDLQALTNAVLAPPADDYEWGCGSTLDEIFSFDEATAREQAKSTGTLRKRRKAGPWQEVTA